MSKLPTDTYIGRQIERLKKIALEAKEKPERHAAIDALPALGKPAIAALLDIAEKSDDHNLRMAALKQIAKVD